MKNWCRVVKAVKCHDCKKLIAKEDMHKYLLVKREVWLCADCVNKRDYGHLTGKEE
ncbi:MAG: hypothetical protein KBH82_10255 [Syntrophorhabdaceae bacterium]|nr:hypothetical protein [Syntrophorhabdaceae bacterium]